MSKLTKSIESIKTILAPIVAYYKTLPVWGKVLLIAICILAKMGPDFIIFPLMYKYIANKQAKKAEESKEENDQTED